MRKETIAYPSIVAILIVALSFFGVTAKGQENINVKVISTSNPVGASLQPLGANEKAVDSLSCRRPGYIDQYFQGDKNAYNAALAKAAQCSAGYLSTTLLQQKIADLSTSIAEMDKRLASLANTQSYLAKFSETNLNGLSLEAIPAGQDEPKQYSTATNISEMCVKDSSTGESNATVPIGTAANDTMQTFNGQPAIASQKLKDIQDNNAKIKDALGKINIGTWKYLTSGQRYVNEQANLMGSTLSLAQENQTIAAQYFMPVTMDDLEANYKNFYISKNYISTGLDWLAKKREIKDMTKLPEDVLAIVHKYVPGPQLPKFTTHVKLTVDGQTVIAWLSETDMFHQIQNTINADKTKYQQLKVSYQSTLGNFQTQLNQLVANNYNCQ